MKLINFLVVVLLLFSSCIKTNNCNNVACTEVFNTVSIIITTSNGNPFALDSFVTIKKNNLVIFNIQDGFNNDKYYPVLTDLQKKQSSNDGEIFIFEGFKNSQKIVSEEIVISADCCHVSYVSGKEHIIIQ